MVNAAGASDGLPKVLFCGHQHPLPTVASLLSFFFWFWTCRLWVSCSGGSRCCDYCRAARVLVGLLVWRRTCLHWLLPQSCWRGKPSRQPNVWIGWRVFGESRGL